jgi:hypothetical protein
MVVINYNTAAARIHAAMSSQINGGLADPGRRASGPGKHQHSGCQGVVEIFNGPAGHAGPILLSVQLINLVVETPRGIGRNAAAAHFPRWIRAMDGTTTPYTWLSGYEVMIRERPSPDRLPALSWVGYRQSMSLTADWADHAHSGWASPTCTS